MLLVSATAGIVVLLAFILTTINDVKSSRAYAKSRVGVLAKVVADNSVAAVIFHDTEAAEETLAALAADASVRKAEVLDEQGKVFAAYRSEKRVNNSWLYNTTLFGEYVLEQPVTHDQQVVGTMRITADYNNVAQGLIIRIVTNMLGLIVAYLLGYMFLRFNIKHILDPIARLTNTISEVIDHQSYSLRVEKKSSDELGHLTDGFNQMLSQIELRDAKLRQSDEALSQTQEAIALHDEHLCYQYVNPAFVKLFGYSLDELIGASNSLEPENVDDTVGPTQERIFEKVKEQGFYRGEITLQTKSGQQLPVSIHISPIRDAEGTITGYVSVSSDITEKKQAEERIWQRANFDLLTGLPNRHMFLHRLEQEVDNCKRTDTSLALMFLDLDDFKDVNDSLGHDVGDMLLKHVGERLQGCVRSTDAVGRDGTIARLGGDEFTIILTHFKDVKDVDIVAKRILSKLEEPFQLGNEIVHISASIGITLCPEDATDAEALICHADQTMYNAKNKGRNTYCYFTQSMQQAIATRREMIQDLRIAIEQEQFRVVYQPIIDLSTNKIYKAEALLRWEHPERGMVSPAEFIPVAEDTGLIIEIGNWVFYHVADQLVDWQNTIDKNFQVSINKSPVQFYNKGGKHTAWFDYLEKKELAGSSLVIEITEGLMLDNNPEVSAKLLAYRDNGIQVAVDDFGTGYSSLSYLKKFDVDYIKIDQSFVQNLSIDSEDLVLCEAIIVMAHKLGLKVIAEGVETIEQRDLLFGVGCDYGQGYLFSKPVPAETLETLCITQNKLDHDAKPIYEDGSGTYG